MEGKLTVGVNGDELCRVGDDVMQMGQNETVLKGAVYIHLKGLVYLDGQNNESD